MARAEQLKKPLRLLKSLECDREHNSRSINIKMLAATIFYGLLFVGCSLSTSGVYGNNYEKATGPRRDIKGVAVVVELEKPPGSSQAMSRNQLQTDVETKIRQAGVKVVSHKTQGVMSEMPLIYINVKIAKIEEKYVYNADLVCLSGSKKPDMRSKLANCNLESAGLVSDIVQVREKLADLINLFIKDYLIAQSEKPAVPFQSSRPSPPSPRLTVPLA